MWVLVSVHFEEVLEYMSTRVQDTQHQELGWGSLLKFPQVSVLEGVLGRGH